MQPRDCARVRLYRLWIWVCLVRACLLDQSCVLTAAGVARVASSASITVSASIGSSFSARAAFRIVSTLLTFTVGRFGIGYSTSCLGKLCYRECSVHRGSSVAMAACYQLCLVLWISASMRARLFWQWLMGFMLVQGYGHYLWYLIEQASGVRWLWSVMITMMPNLNIWWLWRVSRVKILSWRNEEDVIRV